MSQQKKLEKVLDLLLSENSDQASELLHQIIVEKARIIYESIIYESSVDEECDDEMKKDKELDELDESDEVGGEPNKDFTDEIKSDADEIDTDEENDGEAASEMDFEDDEDDMEEDSTEDRVEDLESQLAELRAEFDTLMGEEMEEPNHADLADEMDEIEDEFDGEDFEGEDMHDESESMFEKSKKPKLEKAPEKKDLKKSKKMDEETKFMNAVADTGQRGTAKLVGTGKNTPLGAEQTKSSFTNIPARKDYGGKPSKMGVGTGGEPGKMSKEAVAKKTPSDNVDVKPKASSIKADTTAKFTGGKAAGAAGTKSPFSKKPS